MVPCMELSMTRGNAIRFHVYMQLTHERRLLILKRGPHEVCVPFVSQERACHRQLGSTHLSCPSKCLRNLTRQKLKKLGFLQPPLYPVNQVFQTFHTPQTVFVKAIVISSGS